MLLASKTDNLQSPVRPDRSPALSVIDELPDGEIMVLYLFISTDNMSRDFINGPFAIQKTHLDRALF